MSSSSSGRCNRGPIGEVQSRADFAAELPERVKSKVVELHVGARHSSFDDEKVRHEIDHEFLRRRIAVIDKAAQQFQAGIGSGS